MTTVTISGRNFLIDGQLPNKGRPDGEGQLFGYRWVQGIFDDHTPPSPNTYAYDGRNNRLGNWTRPRDPDRHVNELIAMLPAYRAKGIRGFTLSMQGGAVMRLSGGAGFEGGGDGITAWNSDGSLKPEWKARLIKVLDACDRLGIVVNLQCFYRRRLSVFKDDAAIKRAMRTLADVICERPYKNVLYEVCNEWESSYRGPGYLNSTSKLMAAVRDVRIYAQNTHGQTLYFSTSQGGGAPSAAEVAEFDYICLQSGLSQSAGTLRNSIQAAKNAKNVPIIVTEGVDKASWPKVTEAVKNANVGWFLYDQGNEYPNAGGDYNSGYQSPPVNWKMSTAHKQDYANLMSQMAGSQTDPDPTPPAVPTGVTVVPAGATGLKVTWSAVADATAYSVQWRAKGTDPWSVAQSQTPEFTITGLTHVVYEVQVAATNAAGSSAYSAIVEGTPESVDPDPTHHAHDHGVEPHPNHAHHHHRHGAHPHGKDETGHHHPYDNVEPPPPPPPPTGDGPRLPRPAEPSGTVVTPSDLLNKVSGSAEGTQFILSAGVYKVQSFKPKSGQKFWGREGAVFDGGKSGLQPDMKTSDGGGIDAKAGGASPVNVEVRYVEVRNYLGTGIRPWIGWKVLDNWVHDVAGTGIGSGLEANHCQGGEIAYNEVYRCGHTETTGHDAGGIKLARTGPSNYDLDKKCDWNNGRPLDSGFHVHHNYVHHNSGNGIWWDVSAGGDRADHNRTEYNQRKGIFFEISPGAFWCDHNISKHNGWERAAADYGLGVKGCKDTTIRDNEVDDNGHEAKLNDAQNTYFIIDPDTFHNNGTGTGWVVCKSAQRSPGSGWGDAGGGRAYMVEQTGFATWQAAIDWVGANRTPWKYLKQGILCASDERVPISGCNSNGSEARNDFIDNKLNGDDLDIKSGGGARTVSGNTS